MHEVKKLTLEGKNRFQFILDEMRAAGYISAKQWKHSMLTGNFGSPIKTY